MLAYCVQFRVTHGVALVSAIANRLEADGSAAVLFLPRAPGLTD